jgi:multidrug efflux system membrane fusion protein
MKSRVVILFLISLALPLVFTGCGGEKMRSAVAPAVPVTVAPVVRKSMPLELNAIGTVEAYKTVTIKPQVSGELVGVHFSEGQDVRRGQLLFTIDRRPFQAALEQTQGALLRDLAQQQQARVQANRYLALFKDGVIAKEQLDEVQATADALDATVAADKANVDNARVNLDYCTITSPMDGRTGNLLLHQGNLLKANDDGSKLVVINQIAPIYVAFSVPEQYLEQVRSYDRAGKLRVKAVVPGGESHPSLGSLSLINNTVDPATGTITLKAVFPNADKVLWPGQFVNVVLVLADEPDRIVVPSQAVQTGQQGQYVYVLKGDTVENRVVKVERTLGQETVIAEGLQPGEQVVTDGQSRLVPGSKVQIKTGLGSEAQTPIQPTAGGVQ